MIEGTALAADYQRALETLPWYKRWNAKRKASKFDFGSRRTDGTFSDDIGTLTCDLLGRQEEILIRGRQIESDVRERLQSLFERENSPPHSIGIIAVSNFNYTISIVDFKTKPIKKRIPVGELTASGSTNYDGWGGNSSRSSFVYGTLEGRLHTFKLEFKQKA